MIKELTHIDAHAHLNFDTFDDDQSEVIDQMKERGIGAINIGVDTATSLESIELAEEHDHIKASVGCHPTEVGEDFSADLYEEFIKKEPEEIVAVGECGIDYFRSNCRSTQQKQLQKQAFEAQIQLAINQDLPLILHMRPQSGSLDAYEDGLEILEYYAQEYGDDLRGTAHFFVGDSDCARRFLDIGFFISATGVITFDDQLPAVFANIPTNRLLVETDAPFAAPAPHRGKRNSPLLVPDIVSHLAEITNTPEDELAQQLITNTRRLFSL